jgi:hypothetical protein
MAAPICEVGRRVGLGMDSVDAKGLVSRGYRPAWWTLLPSSHGSRSKN